MCRPGHLPLVLLVPAAACWALKGGDAGHLSLLVPRVDDFTIDGTGSAPGWAHVPWTDLHRRGTGGLPYTARFKVAYSSSGLYFLMEGTDDRVTATLEDDFLDLWTEDVFEVFLWPDERDPLYFEYEISPLGYELPILVPNLDGRFLGWRPWKYTGKRRVVKKTTVLRQDAGGGGGRVQSWRAEFFVPYDLLRPLRNVPPRPGARWRANFYRVDHDGGETTAWDWARVGPSFHEFHRFGTLVFGD